MKKVERIAVFGLGVIGFGMASNLLKAGYPVSVTVHRNIRPVELLVEQGALECESKRKAVESSDIILLCLPNSVDVKSVIDEVLPSLNPRHMVVDTGTSSVVQTRDLAERLELQGIKFAESPVAGGKLQAEAAELGAFVGSSSETFCRVEPVLESFCSSIMHFGEVGAGGRAKLISNYLVLGMVRLIIETFHAANELEIDWEKFYRIICLGSGNSVALQRMIGSIMDSHNHKGYVFSVQNAWKDLQYIAELSQEYGLESTLSDSPRRLFRNATKAGFGDLMVSELLQDDIGRMLTELLVIDAEFD